MYVSVFFYLVLILICFKDINNSSKNYNFHYNLYYPLASDIKLDENSKYNDLIKTYDSDIVAVRTYVEF